MLGTDSYSELVFHTESRKEAQNPSTCETQVKKENNVETASVKDGERLVKREISSDGADDHNQADAPWLPGNRSSSL